MKSTTVRRSYRDEFGCRIEVGFGDALTNMGDPEKFAASLATLTPAAQQAALAIQSIYTTTTLPLQRTASASYTG